VIATSKVFSDEPFVCAMNALGEDSVMYSVDLPFEIMAQASAWFAKAPMSDEAREKVSRKNAATLLKL
jgi:2,3-dihydroxybenzoate decarboxylase